MTSFKKYSKYTVHAFKYFYSNTLEVCLLECNNFNNILVITNISILYSVDVIIIISNMRPPHHHHRGNNFTHR